MDKKEVVRDGYGLVLWLSIAGLLISLFISVYYYRQAFGSTISSDPNYWSAFGTYFGGVFGPLVSFVTLMAILKTIKLQSVLLETQSHEFSVMQEIQMKTLVSQQELSDRALRDSARQEIEACRSNLLAMLDRYMHQAQTRLESSVNRFDTFAQWILDGKAANRENDVIGLTKMIEGIRREITDLNLLIVDVNFKSFDSAELMREFFNINVQTVFRNSAKTHYEAKSYQAASKPPSS